MQKMGYIVGTGLGKNLEGRIDPVTAVILPAGKSLGELKKRAFSSKRKVYKNLMRSM